MTKRQAIRELGKLGFEFVRNDGKYCVWFRKDNRELLADPRDLLAEVRFTNAMQGK